MSKHGENTPPDLNELQERMADYAKLYLTSDLDNQRLAVATALYEVARYFDTQGFPPESLLPLIRPAHALAERENNALDKMFSQRPRAGRPKSTTGEHMRTAMLAILADAWLKSHKEDDRRQSVLLAEAARNMHGPWFKDVSGATLKTAREIVSREAKDHMVREFADRFSAFFEKVVATVGEKRAFPLMVRYINEHEVSREMGNFETPDVSPFNNS